MWPGQRPTHYVRALPRQCEGEFSVNASPRSVPHLARSINLLMGRAAFETAKRLYPKDLIEYPKGAQVLDRSCGEG